MTHQAERGERLGAVLVAVLVLFVAACSRTTPPATTAGGPQIVMCPAPSHFVSDQGCVAEVKCPVRSHFVEQVGCVGEVSQPAEVRQPATGDSAAPETYGRGKATLVLVTPGAKVELVSGSDRRIVTQFPIRLEIANDKAWTIEATKPGFRPYIQPIRFEENVTEKTFNIELSK